MPVLAAIDLGANSVRLSIARFVGKRRRVIHQDREVVRLGAAVFRHGQLDPEAMAQTVKVLRRFRRACVRLGARQVRVVATSALRDAANARIFQDWVRTATGWNVEIISGLEEGRLIHLGISTYARLRSARVLLVDLGGGSCEFTVSVDGHIRAMHSLSLGAVRLTQEFLPRDPPRRKDLARLRAYIAEQLERIAPEVRKAKIQLTLATSGTAAALAVLSGGGSITRAALAAHMRRLAKSDAAARSKMRGVGPRRAEIIVAGAALFSEMLPCFGLNGFRYSPLGLRDGLLAQMAAEMGGGETRQIAAERWDALQAMGRHYGVDPAHAERVRAHVLWLFRRLRRLHQLPLEYAEWLGAAAMLYEVGNYVNRTGARRHAYYLIAHSEIFGYTAAQRHLIAALARYQGRSRPPADDIGLIRGAALLRLARALDQSRKPLAAPRLVVGAQAVRLTVAGELELWALEKERPYFRALFARDLDLRARGD
ncbi:MAG TPA: Ppx/GppA phosphatase family protein [Terriglobales bacterium]|nr:Ppx/GppA phosphatase family protein [Terriglobales bacterium]